MEKRLLIPKNWQDFEMLCQKLWVEIWVDINAQRNGRQGQPQSGVDIWGVPAYRGFYAGVQCKDRDSRLGKALSATELDEECKKAQTFKPHLEQFTMATTAPRDESIQGHARQLTENKVYQFSVHVWSWDDIEEELRSRPKLLGAYYPEAEFPPDAAARLDASFISHRDQCHAFFSRPEVMRRVPDGLREFALPLFYELSDNAYRHGKASRFTIVCEDSSIRIEDNGIPFDPLAGLDASKTSSKSHIGSYVFDAFRREYEGRLSITYERKVVDASERNCLTLAFTVPTASLATAPVELEVDIALANSRDGAEALAASIPIPADAATLVITIPRFYNISALVEFIEAFLQRLDPEKKLIIYLPRFQLLASIASWFDDPRLSIRFR